MSMALILLIMCGLVIYQFGAEGLRFCVRLLPAYFIAVWFRIWLVGVDYTDGYTLILAVFFYVVIDKILGKFIDLAFKKK